MVVRESPVSSRGGVLRSAARAFALLEALAAHPDGATPKTFSAELGLHLSTVYHLLATLRMVGYVVQEPESRLFRLGPRVPWLNDAFQASLHVAPWVLPFLNTLSEATGETTILCRWWGEGVVISAMAEGKRAGHIAGGYVGWASLPHVTAAGLALLAWASDRRREVFLTRPDLSTDDRAAVEAQLAQIRSVGYVIDRGATSTFWCAAAPVVRADGAVDESLAVVVPPDRFAREEAAMISAVVAIAQAASAIEAEASAGWPGELAGAPSTRREDVIPALDAALRALSQ